MKRISMMSVLLFMAARCSSSGTGHQATSTTSSVTITRRAPVSTRTELMNGYLVDMTALDNRALTVTLSMSCPADGVIQLHARQDIAQEASESILYVKAMCDGSKCPVQELHKGLWEVTSKNCKKVSMKWQVLAREPVIKKLGSSYVVDGGGVLLTPQPAPREVWSIAFSSQDSLRGVGPWHKSGDHYTVSDVKTLMGDRFVITDTQPQFYEHAVGVDLDDFGPPPGAGSFAGRVAGALDAAAELLGWDGHIVVMASAGSKLHMEGRGSWMLITRPETMPFVKEMRTIRRIVTTAIPAMNSLNPDTMKPECRWWVLGSSAYAARLAMVKAGFMSQAEFTDLIYWEVLRPIRAWVKAYPQTLVELGSYHTKHQVARLLAAAGTAAAFYLERTGSRSAVLDLIRKTPQTCTTEKLADMVSPLFSPTAASVIKDMTAERKGALKITMDMLSCTVEKLDGRFGALGMKWGIGRSGAVVMDVYDGPAKKAGIMPGDELIRVGKTWILSRSSLTRALVDKPEKVSVLVRRDGRYERLTAHPGLLKNPPRAFVCH